MTFPNNFPGPQAQGLPQFPGSAPQGLPQFPAAAPAQPTQSASDFLSGGGKSITFGSAETGYKRLNKPGGGTVVPGSVKVSQVVNFNTKLPEFWPNGDPKNQIQVTLDTNKGPYPEREDGNDDGLRTLYIKGSMVKPFRAAVQQGNNGVGRIDDHATILFCHTGNEGRSYTWSFQYTAPGAAPTATATQPTPAPLAAPAPSANPWA